MLQFNINVPSSVYAKYYFDLRTMAEANEMSFPSVPLSKERALKLVSLFSRATTLCPGANPTTFDFTATTPAL
jgi:hypothetical protein